MDEFQLIEKLFKPLTLGDASALNLSDDVAFLTVGFLNKGIAVTSDTIVEGTHFLNTDPISSIAKKLVNVNISDIIAKGCQPIGAFLNLSWPNNRAILQLEEFAKSLGEALGEIPLLGGDTTKTSEYLVLSMTMLGKPILTKPVLRAGAQKDDLIIVTGNIGDAKIGLEELLSNKMNYPEAILHYQIPQIQNLGFSELIARYATSSIDISDGLLGDAKKIASASNIGFAIDLEKIPFSNEAKNWIKCQNNELEAIYSLVCFGDDYQVLFTIKEKDWSELNKYAEAQNAKISIIGKCIAGAGLNILYNGNKINEHTKLSYSHEL